MTSVLIYGANGYTGELITRLAYDRGLRPILAGRNGPAIESLASQYQLDFRVFPLEDTQSLEDTLGQVDLVVHCAGPFVRTSQPMLEACLRTKTHYTDITGEIAVFEACARVDDRAREAGIMVMPGVGFDVVPSDCLAVHLKNRMPQAESLSLAFFGIGKLSHGTRATMTMNIGRGGAVRRNGKITSVPAGWRTREIDFGVTKKIGVTIPWGDVSTAYYSTGIPNIEVYTVVPRSTLRALKATRYIGWLLQMGPVQRMLYKQIPHGGPTEEQRQQGKSLLWGEATDSQGGRVQSRIQGPEGYTWTALTSVQIAEKILRGQWQAGFQTPAKAYGADLVLETEGVQLHDVPEE